MNRLNWTDSVKKKCPSQRQLEATFESATTNNHVVII